MDFDKLVSLTSKNIVSMFETSLVQQAGLADFRCEWHHELPADMSSRKGVDSGLMARLSGSKKNHLYIIPYQIHRVSDKRPSSFRQIEVTRADQKLVLSKRQPEPYRIRYAIFGPSVLQPLGQRLLAGLISTLYDYRQINVEGEILKLTEPTEQFDPVANQIFEGAGVTDLPLYLFYVEAGLSTDNTIREDQIVKQRNIKVERNQSL